MEVDTAGNRHYESELEYLQKSFVFGVSLSDIISEWIRDHYGEHMPTIGEHMPTIDELLADYPKRTVMVDEPSGFQPLTTFVTESEALPVWTDH